MTTHGIIGTTCEIWQLRVGSDGYGRGGPNGRGAHRWVYEKRVGPIPDGLELDHLCRNKQCVNPDHLEPVTHAENMRRRYADMTHCARGHEFTPENTRSYRNRRVCRACDVIRQRECQSRKIAS